MRSPESNIKLHDTQTALFDYDDVQVVWSQRNWERHPDPDYPWGVTFYGAKGTLELSVRSYDFMPKGGGSPVHGDSVDDQDRYPEDVRHRATELFAAPATRAPMRNFLAARRSGERPVADVERGHISSACCIMGRRLERNSNTGQVVGDEEANRRLTRECRADWKHPAAGDI